MSPRLLGALLVAALAVPAEAAPRAKGKVVRIERSRASRIAPRICDIRADKAGTCLGAQPAIGEVVIVLDESGVLAEAKIVEASPFAMGSSQDCRSLWKITTEIERGDLSSISSRTIGVVDPEIHPRRARVLPRDQFPPSPSGRTDDQVVVAVDRDGDRTPDLVLTQNQCDTSSAVPGGSCIDQWARVGGKLVRVHQTNFASCGF